MPVYKYLAIDDDSGRVEATLEAENEKALEEILAKRGYYLIEAKKIKGKVKTKTHKPNSISPDQEYGNWQYGHETTVPPEVKELHLHQHVYPEEGKQENKLTSQQKDAGEKFCPNCNRVVHPLKRVGWFWFIFLGILFFPVYLIVYAIYYAFFKPSVCPICFHRFLR